MKSKNKTRVDFIDDVLKPHLLDEKDKRKIAKGFSKLGSYHKEIPLDMISAILEEQGIILIDIDFTKYSGIFCGRVGGSRISIAYSYTAYEGNNGITTYKPIENSMLILNWHKIVTKYDINLYLS